MHVSKLLLSISAILLLCQTGRAQGVFTSPAKLTSTAYAQPNDTDSVRHEENHSFSITYLDKTPQTSLIKGSSQPVATDPVKDSLQFLRYVDSLATLRVAAMRAEEVSGRRMLNVRERSLNRLRDIPSILPFFVIANKSTGLVRTRMSSAFGLRQHPVLGGLVSHTGIDLPAPMGALVYATADGYCRQIVNQPDGIGLAIYLTHGRGHQTLYGHLLSTGIKPGDFVNRGQVIGRVGASGLTTGPHLHYGVRYNGQVVDPLPYCFLLSRSVKSTTNPSRK